MLSKEELLKYPDYLLTKYQLEIYRQVESYRLAHNLSKTDLAKQMGVSNPYVSQILNGNFNYTLKKLIEIGLTIGQVPMLSFVPLKQYEIGLSADVNKSYTQTKSVSIDNSSPTPQSTTTDYAEHEPVRLTPKMKVISDDHKEVA